MRSLLAGLLALFTVSAQAQDAEIGRWINSQTINGTQTSCCGPADCHHVQAEYRRDGWWVVVQEDWHRVPSDRVNRQPSIDGEAWACTSQYPTSSVTIYCFFPKPMFF